MSSLKTAIFGKQSKVKIAKEETKRSMEETKRDLAQEQTKQWEAKSRIEEEKTKRLVI